MVPVIYYQKNLPNFSISGILVIHIGYMVESVKSSIPFLASHLPNYSIPPTKNTL